MMARKEETEEETEKEEEEEAWFLVGDKIFDGTEEDNIQNKTTEEGNIQNKSSNESSTEGKQEIERGEACAISTSAPSDPSTLKGKIVTGYQGWFDTPPHGYHWRHWSNSNSNDLTEKSFVVDLWPDLREFPPSALQATPFVYPNGQTAHLYSAQTAAVVYRHCHWMQFYGIDCIFLQRFVSETLTTRERLDAVLKNVRRGSELYERTFVIMYDISSSNLSGSELVSAIVNDWKYLVDHQRIIQSFQYQHHMGHPVVAIWGFGVEGRNGSPQDLQGLLQFFQDDNNSRYKSTVMGGVDPTWKEQADWIHVFSKFDIISPWMVGRSKTVDDVKIHRAMYWDPEIAEFQNNQSHPKKLYMPVVYPGFSWYNLKGKSFNSIPRLGGYFFWTQLYHAIDAGAQVIYVAMFDEVNEGTAIYKVAENQNQIPTRGTFLTLNADGIEVDCDWYLKLCGWARTNLLRRQEDNNKNDENDGPSLCKSMPISIEIKQKNETTSKLPSKQEAMKMSISTSEMDFSLEEGSHLLSGRCNIL